jgi:hypothetical protein
MVSFKHYSSYFQRKPLDFGLDSGLGGPESWPVRREDKRSLLLQTGKELLSSRECSVVMATETSKTPTQVIGSHCEASALYSGVWTLML